MCRTFHVVDVIVVSPDESPSLEGSVSILSKNEAEIFDSLIF